MSSPRLGAGTVRHSRKAAWAWAMALVASAAADGGEVGDDFAGEGGAGGQVAVGVCGGGNAELREEGFDFVFDRHSGLVASVEVGGGGWQTGGHPGVGGYCVKSSKETG